ncbi:protein kinase domain-containing protein [Gordonia sp. VNK21]|uniref:serine/threonine-protein kinase n=1 Tax=Gordonia sp. VNK21 TaxID=3382483 RepID=UPI0038D378C8
MLLGRGGMGEVYRAYDSQRDREVALKILGGTGHDDGTFARRFRRECQVVARLGEPHIIPIHDYGEIDGTLYLDMRLVNGEDLGSVLQNQGPMDPRRAVGVIKQVAAALDAAHSADIVHRDVKPANVLLTVDDFVYLVDFGIARQGSEADTRLTQTGTTVGSTRYMAPEQFDGKPATPASDIYALSAVLYELVTGVAAHSGGTVSEIVRSVVLGGTRPASSVRQGIPAALDGVISRGLDIDPARRFSTAGEFARAAEGALQNGTSAPTMIAPGAVPPMPKTVVGGPDYPSDAPVGPSPEVGRPAFIDPSQPVQQAQSSGHARNSALVPILATLAVLIVAAAVVAIVFIVSGRDSESGEAAVAAESTSPAESATTSDAATPQDNGRAEEAPQTVTTTAAPEPQSELPLGTGLQIDHSMNCGYGVSQAVFVGTRSDGGETSCVFATGVGNALNNRPVPASRSVEQTITAPSKGGDLQSVRCRAAQDGARRPLWKCVGGISGNAVVYVYPRS